MVVIPESKRPEAVLHLFQNILEAIGLPYKKEKTVGPTMRLEYLGINLDTIKMTASIPANKKQQLIRQLTLWLTKSFVMLKQLQSIIEKLMWIAQVVPYG